MAGEDAEDPPLPAPALRRSETNVLFVDVVESVLIFHAHEREAVERWVALADHVRREIAPAHSGRVVKSTGDGMLLTFPETAQAARAALAVQEASRRANAAGLGPRLDLRASIEVCEAYELADDVYGHGVNVAARLLSLAGAGEVVVSANVRDRIADGFDADVTDLGDCFLKHVDGPVRAFRLGPPSPHPHLEAAAQADVAPTVAVLPLERRLGPEDGGALGDIIAEEAIRSLSRAVDVNVISRLSTAAFRGGGASLAEIAQRLKADYVLAGVYDSIDGVVGLSVELVQAPEGRAIWSERFSESVAGILSEHSEMIDALVGGARAAIMSQELRRARSRPIPSLRAYTLLLGAVSLMNRLSKQDFDEAFRLLDALVERWPRHPIPLSWLAHWHVLRVQQGWFLNIRQDAWRAQELTKRALDVDPECSLALAIDGWVHTHLLRRFDEAGDRFDRAVRANPNDALAWLLKGTRHAFMGEGEQAVADTSRAAALSPLDPQRFFYESLMATAHLSAKRYDDALLWADRSLKANRTHTSTLRVKSIAEWRLGRGDAARATARQLMTLEPDLSVSGYLTRHPAAQFDTGRDWAEALRGAGVPD